MIKQFSDLTEQQVQEICEAFAKREGYNWCDNGEDFIPRYTVSVGWQDCDGTELFPSACCMVAPDYPNCKNAMGRIIDGMDDDTFIKYAKHLEVTLENYGWALLKATAQQQFVSVAMALGLLKEGEK